jgi:hypothetical protein
MLAALVVPVSGPMVGTWGTSPAAPLGTQNDDGFELSCTIQGQEINASDAYGQTLVEAIHRGQNWRLLFRGLEWNKTGLLNILQQFGSTGAAGTLTPQLLVIGDRWSKYCQTLLLTAILGNPPTIPQTLTAPAAGFAPNSRTAFNVTSKLREMPLEMILLPTANAGIITPFTTT